ncbi:MAG TPA: hypothetical protein VLB80_00495 [Candidatus Babeliales bacterium]|nr:hypothetical protein [Candidatus Babeliales bacterium]
MVKIRYRTFRCMLRRYLLVNHLAENITKEYVERVKKMINHMPRKILSRKTPSGFV